MALKPDSTLAIKDENQRLRGALASLTSLMIGEKRPDSPPQRPGGPPWPGYPNPMPPGKDWPVKLAHGGPFYNEYGQPISDPSKDHYHNRVPLPQIEHLKQTPEEMKENERIHNQNYPHPSHDLKVSMNYPPPSRLDKHLGPHQGPGGSLRHLPELERLKILKQGLPLA